VACCSAKEEEDEVVDDGATIRELLRVEQDKAKVVDNIAWR
jgi:hypothetical protein